MTSEQPKFLTKDLSNIASELEKRGINVPENTENTEKVEMKVVHNVMKDDTGEKLSQFEEIREKVKSNVEKNQQVSYEDHRKYRGLKMELDKQGVLPKNPIASDNIKPYKNTPRDQIYASANDFDKKINQFIKEKGYTKEYLKGLSKKELEEMIPSLQGEKEEESLKTVESKITEMERKEDEARNLAYKLEEEPKNLTRFDGNYPGGIAPFGEYNPKPKPKLESELSPEKNIEEKKFLEKFENERVIAEKLGIRISITKDN